MVHGRSVGFQMFKSESVSNGRTDQLTGVGARAALHLKYLKACSSTIYRLVKLFTGRGTITNGGYNYKSCLDKSLLLSKTRSSAQNKKMSDRSCPFPPPIDQSCWMYVPRCCRGSLWKFKVQCSAAAKPGLHSDSLILENLLLVQQEKVKSHVSSDQMIPSIINWYPAELTKDISTTCPGVKSRFHQSWSYTL